MATNSGRGRRDGPEQLQQRQRTPPRARGSQGGWWKQGFKASYQRAFRDGRVTRSCTSLTCQAAEPTTPLHRPLATVDALFGVLEELQGPCLPALRTLDGDRLGWLMCAYFWNLVIFEI